MKNPKQLRRDENHISAPNATQNSPTELAVVCWSKFFYFGCPCEDLFAIPAEKKHIFLIDGIPKQYF